MNFRRARQLSKGTAVVAAGALALLGWVAVHPAAAESPGVADSESSSFLARLVERLDAVAASRPLRGARVSALVVRARDGRVLYERSADRPLTPASNMKILTAMAALDAFGPAYRFETPILADALPDASGSVGTLYVRGSGDPVLNSEDWWRVASQLRTAGLRSVRGEIIMDDSAFDGTRWHPDWGATTSRAYHAPVGAISANYNTFVVTVRAGARSGDPVRVEIDPPVAYLSVANRALTGRAQGRRTLAVDRVAGSRGEIVTIDGLLPAGADERTYYVSVLDPTRYAGAVLRLQLSAVGIEVGGGVVSGAVPPDASEIIRFEGRPLADIVRLFVKFSNNTVAETLVKAIGAAATGGQGTWDNGIRAMRERLGQLGVDLNGLTLVDGSGLSYRDKLTPRALVSALQIGRSSFRIGPEFTAALPIAAADGTLAERASGAAGRVRAKTGLLNRVTALSGLAELSDGELAVFSILTNGYRVSDEAAMASLDGFITALVAP